MAAVTKTTQQLTTNLSNVRFTLFNRILGKINSIRFRNKSTANTGNSAQSQDEYYFVSKEVEQALYKAMRKPQRPIDAMGLYNRLQ